MTLPVQQRGIGCLRLVCTLVTLAVLSVWGCTTRHRYHYPSESEKLELKALTKKDLVVDTGAIPKNLPPGPFMLPIKHEHGIYFVKARVNGVEADLVLDWGGWVTLTLMPYMVRESKATLSEFWMPTGTYDGEGDMRTGSVRELQTGEVTFRDLPFSMTNKDLSVILSGAFTVYRAQGLFGLVLLAGYKRFAIDFRTNEHFVGTLPDTLMQHPDRITLPFKVYNGMWIKVSYDGMLCDIKVDIFGDRGWGRLWGEPAKDVMGRYRHVFTWQTTGVGNKFIKSYATRMGVVRAGPYEQRNLIVGLTPGMESDGEPKTTDDGEIIHACGTVGNKFFGKTVVGVDWEKRELYLVPVQGARVEREDPLAPLYWMVGSWRSRSKDGTTHEEHWQPRKDGIMTGLRKSSPKGEPVKFVDMAIRETPEGVFYEYEQSGQAKISFRLTEIKPGYLVFENKDQDYPRRIVYWIKQGKLHSRIEGQVEGVDKVEEREWKAFDPPKYRKQ